MGLTLRDQRWHQSICRVKILQIRLVLQHRVRVGLNQSQQIPTVIRYLRQSQHIFLHLCLLRDPHTIRLHCLHRRHLLHCQVLLRLLNLHRRHLHFLRSTLLCTNLVHHLLHRRMGPPWNHLRRPRSIHPHCRLHLRFTLLRANLVHHLSHRRMGPPWNHLRRP